MTQDVVPGNDIDDPRQGETRRRHRHRPVDRQDKDHHRDQRPTDPTVDIGVPKEHPQQHADDHRVIQPVQVRRQMAEDPMPSQPMICAVLDIEMHGVFRGLKGQRIASGGREVSARGRVQTREEHQPQQQTDHLNERARSTTNTPDKRACPSPRDQTRPSNGRRRAHPADPVSTTDIDVCRPAANHAVTIADGGLAHPGLAGSVRQGW
jgi:hypothetical protein